MLNNDDIQRRLCAALTFASSPLGSPPPAKEPVTAVTANSTTASTAQLQTSDAFAAVAQLFQTSQGQQVRVWFRL